ncbi:DNA polymerase III subunit chi [Nitrospirillum viridazoti]|uniref:DNA polymerase III subunit chi n=1 Tax=Nitrospirillum viridazoti CBAmc TaxID=1441467 RepID=A0A248JVV5_9PROT|nr:DNA polymerase III subunit chi [Nitrospirillum amazonense]ASG22835.1 DNA polymerase III subunit chi [Nitrospirillum amazonense CBAmc]TWB33703.1 DNA polymerase III chi subunit [Nitrospirillum amazonense]
MTEVNFYHLQRSSLEQTLPDLLERSLARGWRAVVLSTVEERAEQLAQHLWTWRPDSFLPHGTAKDGHAADQPIWLTAVDERPNDAQVLFLTDGATSAHMADYVRVCDIFDGIDPDAVAAARQRWKAAKEAGLDLTYWQQTDKGWEKKA